MKRLTSAMTALLMLTLAAVSFGQSKPAQSEPAVGTTTASAPAASQSATKPAAYEGVVLDKDGRPIAGATVRAFEVVGDELSFHIQPLGKLTTGSDGKYSFDPKSVVKFKAFVVAEKNGYAVGFASFTMGGRSGSGEIRMGKPVTTGGTVVDENGKRIAGARVNIFMRHEGRDRETVRMCSLPECEVMAVSTNAKGRFKFKNTPKDNYAGFIVTAPGKAVAIYGSLFPNTGKDDIEVTMTAEAKITGVLKARDGGAPIVGATIQAVQNSNVAIILPLAVTDKDGKFASSSLPAGNVTFRLPGKDGQPADWVVVPQLVNVSEGTTANVTLEAVKGDLVEITVLDEDTDKPIAGAEVKLEFPAPVSRGMNCGFTNDEGVAVVRVMPGEYRIAVNAEDHEYFIIGDNSIVNVEEGKIAKAQVKVKIIEGGYGGVDGFYGPSSTVPTMLVCGGVVLLAAIVVVIVVRRKNRRKKLASKPAGKTAKGS